MCSLYRGPLLPGFDPSFNPTVDSMLPLDGTKLSYTEAHDDSWLPANCLYEFTAVDGQQTKVRLADYGSLGLDVRCFGGDATGSAVHRYI